MVIRDCKARTTRVTEVHACDFSAPYRRAFKIAIVQVSSYDGEKLIGARWSMSREVVEPREAIWGLSWLNLATERIYIVHCPWCGKRLEDDPC